MGALRNHFSISLEGMFDISFFAVDMQLTKGSLFLSELFLALLILFLVPWALEVFGMDLLSVGKVNMFSAKSATLNDIQIEYAAPLYSRFTFLSFNIFFPFPILVFF